MNINIKIIKPTKKGIKNCVNDKKKKNYHKRNEMKKKCKHNNIRNVKVRRKGKRQNRDRQTKNI